MSIPACTIHGPTSDDCSEYDHVSMFSVHVAESIPLGAVRIIADLLDDLVFDVYQRGRLLRVEFQPHLIDADALRDTITELVDKCARRGVAA